MSINKEMTKIVNDTKRYYAEYKQEISKKSVEETIAFFRKKTQELKKEIQTIVESDRSKNSIEDKEQKALRIIMPKAYGLVKMASEYIIHESPYDVQIIGGIALNDGYVAEMGTGEGKTLTATMPAYLNALLGKGVHVITPNNYLAARDYKKMSKVYSLLGLRCGLVEEGAINVETIESKKKAYQADITYGSSSAFAFDYLFDSLETHKDRLVLRGTKPQFAIVDEADAVLFDDARVPFTISGNQVDESLAIDEETKRKERKSIIEALKATKLFASKVKRVRNKEYEALMEVDNQDEYNRLDKEVALIVNQNTSEYNITTLGYATLFCHYRFNDIANILKKYNLTHLTFDQVVNLIVSGKIQELENLFNKYCGKDLMESYDAISKGIMSWYTVEKDKDYTMNRTQSGEYVLSPVINGRTIDRRKYSNGLQQALEIKEKMLNPNIKIASTKLNDTLASIPTAAFFSRYYKLSGMTGTSIVSPLKELYNLDTYTVPPNRMKKVIDRGDIYFDSSATKFDAIFKETLASYKKGQPVLISTTSIAKSTSLARYITERMKKLGININIPVLNANVQDIERESAIIARAGEPGAITIATEMAGRGTDIKLGGEYPTIGQTRRDIINYYIIKKEQELRRRLTQAERNNMINAINSNQELDKMIEASNKDQINRVNENRKKVINAGGLKVIGSGHFKYTRVDNQVKGRCGRQGDVGEIVFFSDPSDLAELGIPRKNVEMLGRIATDNPYEEKKERKLSITGLIRKYQKLAEDRQYLGIKAEQEFEKDLSQFRNVMYEESLRVKKDDDYISYMERYIREISKRIVEASSKRGEDLEKTTSLNHANINYNHLSESARKILGVLIEEEDLLACSNIGEVESIISDAAIRRLKDMNQKNYRPATNQELKKRIDRALSRVWSNFEDLVDKIKDQYKASMIVGLDPKNNVKNYIGLAFDYSFESEIVNLLSSVLNIHYGEEGKYMNHLREIVISPSDIKTSPIEYEESEISTGKHR